MPIYVTKSYLPPFEEYEQYIRSIWESGQLTNQGPLLKEFESKLKARLSVENLQVVSNGTMALQVSLKALRIEDGEIITTPFSYVATTSSILWERCTPVFVDIEPDSLCIDPAKIEAAITPSTKAIMPVHVFGVPCDIEAIDQIAEKHDLKVIYDAAHAFGVEYNGKLLLDNGDISICSFHATKPFHSIEGGCIIAKSDEVHKKLDLIKRFGHHGDHHYMLGTNAKMSEFHAAMGLVNLDHIDEIIEKRKLVSDRYDALLKGKIERPTTNRKYDYSYAYYPVILESEERLNEVVDKLAKIDVHPRRYFYPSLNNLPYLKSKNNCPVSEDIVLRVLCLPLYADLAEKDIEKICDVLDKV